MIMGSGWVDVMPETEFGVWFALFYALMGSILIYHALGDLASIPLTLRQSRFEAEVLSQVRRRRRERGSSHPPTHLHPEKR